MNDFDPRAIFSGGMVTWVKLSEIGDEITGRILRVDGQQEKDYISKQGKWKVHRPLTEEDFIVAKAQKFILKGEVGDMKWRNHTDEDMADLKEKYGDVEGFSYFPLPEIILHLEKADGKRVKLSLAGNMLQEAKRYVAEAEGDDEIPETNGLFHMKVTAKDGKRRIFDGLYRSPNVEA